MKDRETALTVIVSIAYGGVHDDDLRQRLTGASVEDLRRALEALTAEEGALLRAMRRPLTVERLGRHPLGNLVLASAAAALDDYGRASIWLGEQLAIAGAVLPATIEPVRRVIETVEGDLPPRLRFVGSRLDSPGAAVAAIHHAQWALLAPGSLYRTVLSTAAVPDVAGALKSTPARVLWIANLEPDGHETSNMTAIDHLLALRAHGVRVDVVLHDPSATLEFDPAELAAYGVRSVSRALRSSRNPGLHDPQLLRSALAEAIFTGVPAAPAPGAHASRG